MFATTDTPAAALDAQFRAISNCSLDAVTRMECVRDETGAVVDFVYTDMNERGARLLSQPAEALRGRRYGELFESPAAVAHMARLVELMRTGEPFECELRVRESAVGAAWVVVRAVRFGDGVVSTTRDVSERRRADEMAALYGTVVRTMREGVCLVRASDSVMIYANPRFERILGYGPGELDGCHVSVVNAPGWDAAPVIAALRERGEAEYEVENVKKDGTRITCRATTTTIEHPDHGLVWVAVQRDVTEQKRAEADRLRSESAVRHLAAIVESSSDAIIGASADGVIETWNRGAERLYGYTHAEAVGRSTALILPPGREAEVGELLQKIRRGETVEPHVTERRHKDGTLREVSVSYSLILDPDGSIQGLSKITRDVSAARAAERQIRASLREKEVLLQEVHHRVKNNLQVIVSLLKLQGSRVVDAQAREVFEESQGRVRSIALLHEKLYQSRDLAHVDLSDYARGLVQSLQRMHGAPGERVDVAIRAEGVRLGLDTAVPCGLIVNELLTNAFKHAFPPSRASRGRITIEAERCDDEVVVMVSDDGTGLPPGFDFARTRTLGMHLVRTLARQLGGSATFDGTSGTRCTLSFTDLQQRRDSVP